MQTAHIPRPTASRAMRALVVRGVLVLSALVASSALLGGCAQPDVAQTHEAIPAPAVRSAGSKGGGADPASRAASAVARDLHDAASAAPLQPDLRTAFNASRDLYRYAQALAPAVHAGDADATWLMARVVDTCAVYATDPAAYARDSRLLQDMGLDAGAALRAARDHVASRCGRFVAGDDFSLARTTQLRRDAAQAGSLAAEAELLAAGQPLEAGEDYAQELLERVHASFDGEAYSAIAPAVGGLSTASLFGQRDVAPQYRELVWHLAACRLGMDCGPDSPLMTSYCVNGGICSRDRAQGFEEFAYDAAVPRQSADVVRRAVDALVGRRGE